MIKKYIVLFFILILNRSLFAENVINNPENQFIVPNDLNNIPQKIESVIDYFDKIPKEFKKIGNEKKFKEKIIAPWSFKENIIDVKKYNERTLPKIKNCSGSNYQLYDSKIINLIDKNANNYKLVNKPGIITRSSDLRIVPSNFPCFNFKQTGSEYPFDSHQNSRIYIGSPIFIIAATEDKQWFLVRTHEESNGWIKSENFAFINTQDIDVFKKHKLSVILEDNLAVYNKKNEFYSLLNLGVILPTVKSNELLLPISHNHKLIWKKIKLTKEQAQLIPLKFNKANITKTINALLDKPYGWGGFQGDRDCSAMTRDFYSVFATHILRNSKAQANSIDAIKIIDLTNKTDKEKLDLIFKEAIPFRSLIFLPGHIGLYVGQYNKQLIIFHNLWGLRIEKNENSGRNVIGKSVLSTLEIGKEIPNLQHTLLNKITQITIL